MALISCPECGQKISEAADSCPHCGCKINVCPECGGISAGNKQSCPKCGFVFTGVGLPAPTVAASSEQIGGILDEWKKQAHSDAAMVKTFKYVKIAIWIISALLLLLPVLLFNAMNIKLITSCICIICMCDSSTFNVLENEYIKIRCRKWILNRKIDAAELIRKYENLMVDSDEYSSFIGAAYLAETPSEMTKIYINIVIKVIGAILLWILAGICLVPNVEEYILVKSLQNARFQLQCIPLIIVTVILVIVYGVGTMLLEHGYEKRLSAWIKKNFPEFSKVDK